MPVYGFYLPWVSDDCTVDDVADVADITCGHCGKHVGAEIVHGGKTAPQQQWLRCPSCGRGTVRGSKIRGGGPFQYPPPIPASSVEGLPADVATAWDEARTAYGSGAYTAAEIMCRKILMHVAVDKAVSVAGKSFTEYVDALQTAGYITTGLKAVIDSIRGRGNIANHELPASTEQESEVTLKITEHLLRSVYELPGLSATSRPKPKPAVGRIETSAG